MSENQTSQVRETQGAWQKMMDEHLVRVEQAFGEAARFEKQGQDQAQTAMVEMMKLSMDTFSYFGQLSAEWRKLTLEATRKAAGLMTAQG